MEWEGRKGKERKGKERERRERTEQNTRQNEDSGENKEI